jgi:ribonuclease HI
VTRRVKIFFDGGCRPNPGAMEIAVVAAGRPHLLRELGHGSSADAEWLALIHALKIAQSLGREFVLVGDSLDVIGPANGTATCRNGSARHLAAFRALATETPRIRHIKRTQNLAGIALAKLHGR